MGAANSVRKLTVESIALLEQLEPNADEVQKKREVRETVKRLLAAEWSACRVLPFGSSERCDCVSVFICLFVHALA